MGTNIKSKIGKFVQETDWTLLVFLILVLNVKVAVKVIAVVAIYLLRFNFRFLFRLKDSRLPAFYALIIGIACIHFICYRNYTSPNYILVFLTSAGFWILCLLSAHQLKLAVDSRAVEVIHRTLLIFFVINAAVSLGNFFAIIWETGSLNPYRYQGDYQKYFINTGDYIKGISWDTSTTNAVINAYGVIYFLTRKNTIMLLLCMIVLLLTGSNVVNIFLLLTLFYIFLFKSDLNGKSLIVICTMFLVLFMVKISPQNNRYIKETYQKFANKAPQKPIHPVSQVALTDKPDSTLTIEEKKQKIATLYLDSIRKTIEPQNHIKPEIFASGNIYLNDAGKPVIPKPNIHSAPFQSRNDTSTIQKELLQFIENNRLDETNSALNETKELPGKVTAIIQLLFFFKQNPQKIFIGDGPGNFSSKLAFRATGLKIAGGYPLEHIYIHPDFLSHHLKLYLHFFSKSAKQHSLINSPNSVYTQLFSEYGIVGILVFVLYYIRFFIRHSKSLTYGLPLILLLTSLLFIDYWFEQLSVIILFELMLFLNIKETNVPVSTHE